VSLTMPDASGGKWQVAVWQVWSRTRTLVSCCVHRRLVSSSSSSSDVSAIWRHFHFCCRQHRGNKTQFYRLPVVHATSFCKFSGVYFCCCCCRSRISNRDISSAISGIGFVVISTLVILVCQCVSVCVCVWKKKCLAIS